MIVRWTPHWYGLDASIVVGSTGSFYLQKGGKAFANGPVSAEDQEVKAAILGISHPILGAITAIRTEELDYSFLLENGNVLSVNAEEEPGTVGNEAFAVADWSVDVDLEIFQKIKHSS